MEKTQMLNVRVSPIVKQQAEDVHEAARHSNGDRH